MAIEKGYEYVYIVLEHGIELIAVFRNKAEAEKMVAERNKKYPFYSVKREPVRDIFVDK